LKTITLKQIKLKNFKGIKNLEIDFDKDTKIFGDNESGKTSVVDAFMWLMFGKDSQNRADFDIKTLDENNNVINGLEHEVEVTLEHKDIATSTVNLRKIYKENWTKKRGEAERTLTGHTTDHFVNEVPVKKSEYDSYINSLVDESIFKLITNVLYFNTQLDWKKRRELLIEICGDITDDVVINSNERLKTLKELLSDCTIEQLRDKIKGQKSRLNKAIKEIPIRIDELNNSVKEEPDLSQVPIINSNIDVIKNQISALDKEIIELTDSQKSVNSKAIEISNLKAKINDLKNNAKSEISKQYNALNQELQTAKNNQFSEQNKVDRLKATLEDLEARLKACVNKKEELYKQYDNTSASQFKIDETQSHCDKCGQTLPKDKLEDLKADFEKRKATSLEWIKTQGIQNNKKMTDYTNEIETIKQSIEDFEKKRELLINLTSRLDAQLQAEKTKVESFDIFNYSNAEIETLEKEVIELEKALDNPDESLKEELRAKMEQKKKDEEELEKARNELSSINQKLDMYQYNLDRIKQLKAEEKDLANKIAELEGQEFATEEFIRTKVNLFESKINSKFRHAKFKLFNTLINGALEETAECTYKGVPFSSLNSSAKINIGLDIINVLSEHYELKAPVFVDNAEGVTKLSNVTTQIIALYVWQKENKLPDVEGKIIKMEALK